MMPTVIVDANILISGYCFDGEVRRYWRECLSACRIVVSPEILIEVELRLRDKEFNLATTEIKAILLDIIERCEIVRPNPPRDAKFENLKDSHLAAIAQNQLNDLAKPVVLLTGDDALLRQGNIGDCRIFEIGEFCNSGMHLPRD